MRTAQPSQQAAWHSGTALELNDIDLLTQTNATDDYEESFSRSILFTFAGSAFP